MNENLTVKNSRDYVWKEHTAWHRIKDSGNNRNYYYILGNSQRAVTEREGKKSQLEIKVQEFSDQMKNK